MSIISVFAGRYSALDYAYGGQSGGPALQIGVGNTAVGVGTITVVSGITETTGGNQQSPLAVGTPVTVGIGANSETVTPTAVTQQTLSGAGPGTNSYTITATFANVHGPQEPVTSGTYGLQEAINAANGNGGGLVIITPTWYARGGTAAILAAAVLPSSGSVSIEDLSQGGVWGLSGNSLTVLAAPSAATSATVASLTTTGTWTAVTEHVLFTYVNADGGETLASADYSFTATVSVAIGGSGPAALAGAVGYRVYIGTNATTTCFAVPGIAANGTIVQCGPIAAFKIGTPFSVALVTTSAQPTPPAQSSAFGAAVPTNFSADYMAQAFQTVYPPFAVTGVVTAGTAKEIGHVQLPIGFLNLFGRTLRIKFQGNFTPVSTATLILSLNLVSALGTTTTAMFTVTSVATTGTGQSPFFGEIIMTTASLGATGTIEAHGTVLAGLVTAGPNALSAIGDNIFAVSSAADLTKQDMLQLTINSGTANLTTAQLRSLIVEVLQ